MGRAFLIRHRRRVSAQPPQAMAVAIGQVERDLDPLPALGRDGFGFSRKLFADQTIEQGRVFQPAAVIALEEVMQHSATHRLIGLDANKDGTTVRGSHRGFRQHAPDLIGLLFPGRPDRLPDLNLALVIRIDREGHQLLQRHVVLGIELEQGSGHESEFQALLDHLRCDEKRGCDLFNALTLHSRCHEGAELIERMQGGALHVVSERVVFSEDRGAGIPHNAGNGRRLGQAFLLHQEWQGLEAPTASGDFELTGLGTNIRWNGPEAQALQQPVEAMSSACSSTEMPTLMRRTLDWLSTSLSKGISREGDRVTYRADFAIRSSPRRTPEATLQISLPVTPFTALLYLSTCPPRWTSRSSCPGTGKSLQQQ